MRYLLFVTATVTLLIKWSVAGAQFSDSNSNVLLTPEQITSVVIDGTVNDLQKIIKSGDNINKPLPNSTILNMAIHSIIVNKENLPEMAVEKVKVLIEAGVDVNYSPYGMSPLIMAVTIPAQIRQAENKMIEDINKQPSLYISQLGREETKESLYNVIKETKKVIYLRIFGNLEYEEIAQIMNRTASWARVVYFRGKQKLKEDKNERL